MAPAFSPGRVPATFCFNGFYEPLSALILLEQGFDLGCMDVGEESIRDNGFPQRQRKGLGALSELVWRSKLDWKHAVLNPAHEKGVQPKLRREGRVGQSEGALLHGRAGQTQT